MFRILDRYLLREVALTWLAATSVLLFILLTNQFAQVLGDAQSAELFTVLRGFDRGAMDDYVRLVARG